MSQAESKNYPAIFLLAVKPTGYNTQPHPAQREKPHAVSLNWAHKKPGRFFWEPLLCFSAFLSGTHIYQMSLFPTGWDGLILCFTNQHIVCSGMGPGALIFTDNCSPPPPLFLFFLGGQLLVLWHTAAPPSVCRHLTYWVDKHLKLPRSAASLKLH